MARETTPPAISSRLLCSLERVCRVSRVRESFLGVFTINFSIGNKSRSAIARTSTGIAGELDGADDPHAHATSATASDRIDASINLSDFTFVQRKKALFAKG
jgi:hypothetical protein